MKYRYEDIDVENQDSTEFGKNRRVKRTKARGFSNEQKAQSAKELKAQQRRKQREAKELIKSEKAFDKTAEECLTINAKLMNKITANEKIIFSDNSCIKSDRDIMYSTETYKEPVKAKQEDAKEEPAEKQIQTNKPVSHAIQVDRDNFSTRRYCSDNGLRFHTDDERVIMLFRQPLRVPLGSVYHIKDQFLDCDCRLEQVINKTVIMLVFRRLPIGSMTTYTPISLADCKSISYLRCDKIP